MKKFHAKPLLLAVAQGLCLPNLALAKDSNLEVIQAQLTAPPFAPKPIERNRAAKVVVDLEMVEKTMELSDGAQYQFWTFGGTVPGSFIRIREGDTVEFKLKNQYAT